MKRPVIGITSYGRDDHQRFGLPAVYVDAVRRAGGLPVILPPGEDDVTGLLSLLDGIILSGGGDISPQFYGGVTHATNYMVDVERDSSEIRLARHLITQDTPLLGICRGTQIINVALGGTLIEHLPDLVGEAVLHRAPPRLPVEHEVVIDPASRLASIVGESRLTAASWHHQAIRQPGAGLQVVGHAPDGTIEAVEKPGHPWLIAVQWHPELTAADDPVQQRLFDGLVEAAKRR
jgi:putative glutamine amidotransferase